VIFDGPFLILFSNIKKHPGEFFSFLISQINFEKMKFSDIRNQGVIKQKTKNEDTKKTNGYSTKNTKTKRITKHTHEKHTRNQIFNRRFGPELKYKIQI
jgi:hypothetical protein